MTDTTNVCTRCNMNTAPDIQKDYYTTKQAKQARDEAGLPKHLWTINRCAKPEEPTKPFYHVMLTKKPTQPPKEKCSCTNHLGHPKQQYKTKTQALKEALTHYMEYNNTIKTYRCPKAGTWHITTKPPKRSYNK